MPLSLLLWMTTNPDKSLVLCLPLLLLLLTPSSSCRPSWLFLYFLCCFLFLVSSNILYFISYGYDLVCLFFSCCFFCVAWVVLFTSKPDIVCPVQSVKPNGALKSCRVLSVYFVLGKSSRKKTQGKAVISVIRQFLILIPKKMKAVTIIILSRWPSVMKLTLVPSLHLLFACDSVMTLYSDPQT